jgi:hypothetical protein
MALAREQPFGWRKVQFFSLESAQAAFGQGLAYKVARRNRKLST